MTLRVNVRGGLTIRDECQALLSASSLLGGRWTFALLSELSRQPMRFSELRRKLPMVPGKSLTRALEKLETEGLIERTVLSTRPPRVTYSMVDPDPLLLDLLEAAIRWGKAKKVTKPELR